MFRFVRRIFKFSAFSVAVQDIFFWLTSAVPVFFICIKLNGGYLRIYFIIFTLVGWFIYFKTIGKLIFIVFDRIINIIRRIFAIFRRRIIKIGEKVLLKKSK
ncbi:MAG: spore cortex biosynthesis protein YabQ [Acutalibacteraceae bacterium]